VTRSSDGRVAHLALAAVLVAAFGLAACGRKGPLELPPSAAIDQPATPAQAVQNVQPEGNGPVAPVTNARAPRKHIFLDWLLD
jgi:predicted small lipoprotein YifL